VAKEDRRVREARFDATAARYRRRDRGYDEHAHLRQTFLRLRQDLADAHGDLDAPSLHDWPAHSDVVAAELTLREQFQLLHWRAVRLVEEGYWVARLLMVRVAKLLDMSPGFIAPPRAVTPPRAVGLAIERLTAAGALPVTDDTLEQGDQVGKDARLLIWFLRPLG
jgi:hypothetical protein